MLLSTAVFHASGGLRWPVLVCVQSSKSRRDVAVNPSPVFPLEPQPVCKCTCGSLRALQATDACAPCAVHAPSVNTVHGMRPLRHGTGHESRRLQLHLAALGSPRPYVMTQEQIQAAQQGSLDGDQLTHLHLLAELFVINRDHVAAAEVMTAIGVATVLQSTPESARPDRVMALHQALVHVRSLPRPPTLLQSPLHDPPFL